MATGGTGTMTEDHGRHGERRHDRDHRGEPDRGRDRGQGERQGQVGL